MEKKFSTKVMAEIALLAAFAVVLDLLQSAICKLVPFWSFGGSVGIAMIPIFILAYRRGLVCGLLGGLIVGLLDMMDGVDISPLASNGWLVFASVMLDYVLAWTVVGFAGLLSKKVKEAKTKKLMISYIICGVIIGGLARLSMHFLSGMYMWENMQTVFNIQFENMPAWLYSLCYNASYIVPCIILCSIICPILIYYQPKVLVLNYNIDKMEA